MKKIIIVVAVVALIGIILYFSLFYGKEGHVKEVYTYEAEKGDILSTVIASGRIEPRTKVNISSNVIGEIVELVVKEGNEVKKGDFLLQIDKEKYLSEVERLEANVRLSKIMIEREKINLKNVENNLRRKKKLYQDQIISDNAIEDAELEYETAKINLKSLNEQTIQAEADLEKAQDELKKTKITSPMDGIVTQLNAEAGEQVIMGTINNPGTVIMVISDMREVLAEADVDETEIVSVKRNNEAKIKVDAIGDKYDYEGYVEEIGNTAIKQGEVNIFHVKVKIRNPDEKLMPGMTARAKIETESRYDVLKVPLQAVVLRDVEKEKEKLGKKDKIEEEQEEKTEDKIESEEQSTSASEKKDLKDIQAKEEIAKEDEAKSEEIIEEELSKKWKEKEQEVVYLMVDGKAVITPVETGISDELDVEIIKGLKEGDIVVTGPYRTLKNLKDGDKIKEKEKKKEAEEEEEEEEKESE